MRTLLLCFLLTTVFWGNAQGQRRIGVVDRETINKQVAQAIQLDSLMAISRDTLEKLRKSWLHSFSTKASDFQSHFCGSPEEYKRITSRLQAELDDIGRMDTLAKDSLLIWKRETLASIDRLIREKTSALAKKKKLRLVVDQKQVLFFKSRLDLTQIVAEKVFEDGPELQAMLKAFQDKVLVAIGRCRRPNAYWQRW